MEMRFILRPRFGFLATQPGLLFVFYNPAECTSSSDYQATQAKELANGKKSAPLHAAGLRPGLDGRSPAPHYPRANLDASRASLTKR
jgi:hypothetical protein